MNINIPGIDNAQALKNSGSEEVFVELLGDIYKLIDDKSAQVESYLKAKDIPNFTTLVHALKTNCRMIGAMDLGEDFFTLEKLGKENNLEQIEKLAPDVINSFKALKPYLAPYASGNAGPKKAFDKSAVQNHLNTLLSAIDDFNLATAEEAMRNLFSYNCSSDLESRVETLGKYVSDLDYDEAKELARQILSSL